MNKQITRNFIWVTVCMILISCSYQQPDQDTGIQILSGPYFGQEPPGLTPEVFAPEIYTKFGPAICSVFSPDGNEFFFTSGYGTGDAPDIFSMKQEKGVWSTPKPAVFNSPFIENDICISPQGDQVFFRSWRPLPGQTAAEERSYIWFSTRTVDGWSEAQPVKCGGAFLPAGYPAAAQNGTLYFPYRSEQNVGESDIYRANPSNGTFEKPVSLGSTINTKYIEGDMCVALDESLLVVSCWNRPDNQGESDLYISFRDEQGEWSELQNLGAPINNHLNENCPMLSPDGKYFFFLRYDPETEVSNTYWVAAEILKQSKPVNAF